MCPDKTNSLPILTRSRIVEAARGWVGLRFRHQGRTKLGVDCVGLTIMVGKELGIVPPGFDYTEYPRRPPRSREFIEIFERHIIDTFGFTKKSNRDVSTGDIVTMRGEVYPCHCGIIADKGVMTLIHSYAGHAMVNEDHWSDWRDLHVGTYQFPGVQ